MPQNRQWFDLNRRKTRKIISNTGLSLYEINDLCSGVEKAASEVYRCFAPNTAIDSAVHSKSYNEILRSAVKKEFGSARLEHVVHWVVREAATEYKSFISESQGRLEYESRPIALSDQIVGRRITHYTRKYADHVLYRMQGYEKRWRVWRDSEHAETKQPATA